MKHFGRLLIIAFCLWHMFAITIYVIPAEATNKVVKKVEHWSLTVVKPYMFITSQWQKWNIFSPNPIRRVSFYMVDIEENGSWRELFSLTPQNLPWWKQSRELKVMRRVEDDGERASGAYLEYVCRAGMAPNGALIRLRKKYYVIPSVTVIDKMGGWAKFRPDFHEEILREIYCPIATT